MSLGVIGFLLHDSEDHMQQGTDGLLEMVNLGELKECLQSVFALKRICRNHQWEVITTHKPDH